MKDKDRYCCDVLGCGKSFSRSDHLSRHKTNHAPSVLYKCGAPGCVKTFVRKDVKEKHEYRHRFKLEKTRTRGETIVRPVSTSRNLSLDLLIDRDDDEVKLSDEFLASATPSPQNMVQNRTVNLISNTSNSGMKGGHFSSISSLLNSESINEPESKSTIENDTDIFRVTKDSSEFVPTDLTQWLFVDETFLDSPSNLTPTISAHDDLVLQTSRLLQDGFNGTSSKSLEKYQTHVENDIVQRLINLIPQLRGIHFGAPQIKRCLELYWAICHVQFPILHKPSFNASTAHPLLLLGLIMMGAGVANFSTFDESGILNEGLADAIAVPLRWLILSSDDFCSPPQAWIIQVLIILEIYETLLSSRKLHERAYLHHGLKIQLLRRSPLLGGDPRKQHYDSKELVEDSKTWESWIELESLKRATLVSFYLDTVHAIIFGHEIILFAHQIKLSMPCDDVLWEMPRIDVEKLPPQAESSRFINALTKLLHQENFEAGPLSKKILLAGLLTINVQMENKDLEVKFLDWKPMKDSWKDTLQRAIEVWRNIMCLEDCCDSRNAFYLPSKTNPEIAPLSFTDKRCKFSIYHLSQTFMRIKQYDCIIFAGASKRMNVKTTEGDFKAVSQRIKNWASSYGGRISVLHCYIFLFEMLFNGNEKHYYNPATDAIFHRSNIVASSLLVIWAYNFSLEGAESASYLEYHGPEKTIQLSHATFKEEGFGYLQRIMSSLKTSTQQTVISNKFLAEYSEVLLGIENKHHLVGLLSLFLQPFRDCQSELCKEYGELIQNCIERSLGKQHKISY